MKKIFRKSNIFSFLLGAVIFGGIVGVSAYSVLANNIGYTPSDSTWKKSNGEDITNVKDAIDELYTKSDNYNLWLSGLEELSLNNISLVENKEVQLLNNQSGTLTYDNLNDGSYLLYAFRTVTISESNNKDYATSSSRASQTNPRKGIPTISVNSGTIAKISDEVYIINIANDSSSITINSNAVGSSTTAGGYIYSALYSIN